MPWFWQGLRERVRTLHAAGSDPPLPGLSPGRPTTSPVFSERVFDVSVCPTGALTQEDGEIHLDFDRCVHCLRCQQGDNRLRWANDYAWAHLCAPELPQEFRHSVNVRVVDTGDCGACLNEVRLLSSPIYSLHRFGIYITPTPREADVLLVVGPVTVAMRASLEETYQAMPEPRRVIAVGVCALNGGVFRDSFTVLGGLNAVSTIPVDVTVPGCPPPPLAILDAIRMVMGQRSAETRPEAGIL